MRELSTCDFCGESAAGVYEVVPGDISGVDARRMVLCGDCRDTLSDVVDPLLAAGRRGGSENAAGKTADTTAAHDSPAETTQPSTPGGEATEPTPESGREPAPESGSGPEPTAESGPEPTSESGPEPAAEPGPDPESASEPDSVSESGTASGPDSETEAESTSEPEPETEIDPVERPPAYGKVVRLVENRDSGIRRRDLEELATGAYGLGADEVNDAIEFALEQGTFEETDGGLRTVPV